MNGWAYDPLQLHVGLEARIYDELSTPHTWFIVHETDLRLRVDGSRDLLVDRVQFTNLYMFAV